MQVLEDSAREDRAQLELSPEAQGGHSHQLSPGAVQIGKGMDHIQRGMVPAGVPEMATSRLFRDPDTVLSEMSLISHLGRHLSKVIK